MSNFERCTTLKMRAPIDMTKKRGDSHELCGHMEMRQRGRSEACCQRGVGGVPTVRHHDPTNAWDVVTGVERVPRVAQIDFDPGAEIHGCGVERDADVTEVSRCVACGNAQAPTKRNRQVREVATDALLFVVRVVRALGAACKAVAEFDVVVDPIDDGAGAGVTGRPLTELLPREVGQSINLAISRCQQVGQGVVGKFKDRVLWRVPIFEIGHAVDLDNTCSDERKRPRRCEQACAPIAVRVEEHFRMHGGVDRQLFGLGDVIAIGDRVQQQKHRRGKRRGETEVVTDLNLHESP